MRIIGGKYRGRRITPPKNFGARPTTDFAREALFNIINNRVDFESISVADLFSGTGSISFEFASRGVPVIHLVEKDPKYIAGINKVLHDLGINSIRVIHADVRSYLKTCHFEYDIVFADPPFGLPWLAELSDLVLNAGIIKESGFFILEHPGDIDFAGHKQFFEHRNYGSVNFSFFRPPAGD